MRHDFFKQRTDRDQQRVTSELALIAQHDNVRQPRRHEDVVTTHLGPMLHEALTSELHLRHLHLHR